MMPPVTSHPATESGRYHRATLRIASDQLSTFFPYLQRGVTVPAQTGCTLRSLLCEQFAIPADYVTGRITTIFLDNKPVDDLDRALIRPGARVTLSAAMPGLVGAVMRRSGFYAALRAGISHAERQETAEKGEGRVTLKLFNLLLSEVGPVVLARGIVLKRREVDALLRELPGAILSQRVNGGDQVADPESEVLLTVSEGKG